MFRNVVKCHCAGLSVVIWWRRRCNNEGKWVVSWCYDEDTKFEYKAILNRENPVKWAKNIVAYANGAGGYIFIGVSNERDAFGLDLRTIDETKNLIELLNNRFIFPHAKLSYMMRSVDEEAERFVLVVKVLPLTPYNGYMKWSYSNAMPIFLRNSLFLAVMGFLSLYVWTLSETRNSSVVWNVCRILVNDFFLIQFCENPPGAL